VGALDRCVEELLLELMTTLGVKYAHSWTR
jgi:hypothetical protein